MKSNEKIRNANGDTDRSQGAFSRCRTLAVEFGDDHYGAPGELKTA